MDTNGKRYRGIRSRCAIGAGVLIVSVAVAVHLMCQNTSINSVNVLPALERGHDINPPELALPNSGSSAPQAPNLTEHRTIVDAGGVPLTLEAEFALGTPSPQYEATMRPLLERAFQRQRFEVECRKRICRIAQPSGEPPNPEWAERIQHDPDGVGMFSRLELHGGREITLYLEMSSDPGFRTLVEIVTALHNPQLISSCRAGSASIGELNCMFKLDASRHVAIEVSGELANEPFANCVRARFQDALAKIPIPPEVQTLPTWYMVVKSP